MATKDFNDEYLEKLDRISRLKKSGDITDEEYRKQKEKLDRIKKAHESPSTNIIVAVVLFLLVGFFVWVFVSASNSTDDADNAQPLDIGVVRNIDGIVLQNNEADILTGCEVTINGKYSARVETIDSQERTYSYSVFTDNNGTRFNIYSTQPEELTIHGCRENPDRFAAYNW